MYRTTTARTISYTRNIFFNQSSLNTARRILVPSESLTLNVSTTNFRSHSTFSSSRLISPSKSVTKPQGYYRKWCDKAEEPISPKPRLHMVFTCAKCETRAVKSFTKDAYEKGVVLVTCPGCDAQHVIADNLGWFGPEKNIEQILSSKGETVTRISDEDLEYTPSSSTKTNE